VGASDRPTVRAAGGVVWRLAGEPGDGRAEVVLVHRPRYDDWTLPKGKAEPGETDEQTALREVEEETGLRCILGAELASSRYVDNKGRDKLVRYWVMQVADEGAARLPDDEVDEVRWVPLPAAPALLSYPRDLAVLESFEPPGPPGAPAGDA
jgi:8-oxo-dGTP pyrophosphatase MutT (NUDIX family)